MTQEFYTVLQEDLVPQVSKMPLSQQNGTHKRAEILFY